MKFEEDNWREKDSMKETFVSVKARKERNEEEKEKYYLYQWLGYLYWVI
jgi:predicted branched-subunit amino acid permease